MIYSHTLNRTVCRRCTCCEIPNPSGLTNAAVAVDPNSIAAVPGEQNANAMSLVPTQRA